MIPPAAISFDVNGTLLGIPRLGEIYAEVFARHGLEAAPEALAGMVREVWQELAVDVRLGECRFERHPEGAKGFWRDLVFRVAARLELPAATPFLAAELYERFASAEAWQVYPEVPRLFSTLRQAGVRLAVTSNFDSRLPRLLAETGLADALEVVVYSAEVGVEKPHPAIFEELLEALELPPRAVVHVGDSRRDDVEGAVAVGMRALWLTRGARRGDLASLAELPARLALPDAPG